MTSRQNNFSTQKGTAIIMALFVMSIVATISIAMMGRLSIDIQRTELLLKASDANLYAQGSIAWAMDVLNTNLKNRKVDKLTDLMPIESPVDTANGFTISSNVEDMQGYFNVNNLINDIYQSDFIKLLQTADPKLDANTATVITQAVKNWILPANKINPYETEYANSKPPYAAPHKAMSSVSELRLVKGMTPKLYEKLTPYITALPEVTPININSVPAAVLMSLSPSMTTSSATQILAQRKSSPFKSVAQFLNLDVVKNNPINPSKLTVESHYFLIKTQVSVGQQETILYTLVVRTIKDSKPTEMILWQTKGTL